LWNRKLTTVLTVSGMALVVFVFSAVLMLADGLKKTLVSTGSPDNALVLRRSSTSEVMSTIDRYQAGIIAIQPEIALGEDGLPLLAKELLVLITLNKRGTTKVANVTLRGVDDNSWKLRPNVHLIAGRRYRKGANEIVVGKRIAERFEGCALGESIKFGQRRWLVVGIMDAGNTEFSSEVWGDVDQFMQAFRRPVYSGILFKLKDRKLFQRVKKRLENDPRLTVIVKTETQYYKEQSELMERFIKIVGMVLTSIFSLGAVIGAMITMYSNVANRIVEIGTLRAIGFGRTSVLVAFLSEALLLGLIGGLIGLSTSSFLQTITVSTTNWKSFSEVAFKFTLTPQIALSGMAFAAVMGLVGGALPSIKAARLPIVEALHMWE
ncbi:MAG TPA: ABC transporter permease, partial [Deltaproteobacteria bacterium]|nr:ABC transporter permease [Deltaproteobacteria bacterium]